MESIWTKTTALPDFPALSGDLQTDVAVIGGGLAGILIAYHLIQTGHKAVILEGSTIGSGQTSRTTAKITTSHNLIYDNMISQLGMEKARQYAHANQEALSRYEQLIEKKGISCHYEKLPSYLYSQKEVEAFEKEVTAARQLGLDAEFTQKTSLPFHVEGAVKYNHQAQFHPLEFLGALVKDMVIYEHTKVLTVEDEKVVTEHGTVTAKHVVFATHYPFLNVPGYYFTRMHQERSYAIALEHAAALDGMYLGIDAEDAYSFRKFEDYLILGGCGHRTGKNASGGQFDKLRNTAAHFWPECRFITSWSAQDCVTVDQIPYIGNYSSAKPNWFVATGFAKWGMTTSMVSAMIISDQINGIANPYQEVFSPQRNLSLEDVKSILVEGVSSTKGLSKQHFQLPKETLEELPVSHGGIVDYEGEKVGVYKDDEGAVYMVSTKCPHLGCQLEWNPDEKSWDCPCHGSRFDYTGKLLDNPAQEGLDEK